MSENITIQHIAILTKLLNKIVWNTVAHIAFVFAKIIYL